MPRCESSTVFPGERDAMSGGVLWYEYARGVVARGYRVGATRKEGWTRTRRLERKHSSEDVLLV